MSTQSRHLWRVVRIFGASFGATLAFLWLLIQVYTYFKLKWVPQIEADTLGAIIVICVSTIVAFGVLIARLLSHAAVAVQKPTFERSLIDALGSELLARNYADVIRIGVA